MKKSRTEELRELAEKTVSGAGYEFVDLNFGKRGRNWYIQIFADKEGGITLSDCQKISELIEYELDRNVSGELLSDYRLEVSSPGLERPLKKREDYSRFSGRDAKIKVYAPVEGLRVIRGELVGISDNDTVEFRSREKGLISIELDNIASANLEVNI